MASLDAAYDSDSDSHGEATFAVKGRRLSLEEVLAEVENKPPPIGSGGDEFASPRQRSASLVNPPKRKSLLEQIDTDFPGTRSSQMARRSLPGGDRSSAGGTERRSSQAAGGAGRPPLESLVVSDAAQDPAPAASAEKPVAATPRRPTPPSPADAREQMRRVAAAAAGPHGLTSVWTQPVACSPRAPSQPMVPPAASLTAPSPATRTPRRRGRKNRPPTLDSPMLFSPDDSGAPRWPLPPTPQSEWSGFLPAWSEWAGESVGWAEPISSPGGWTAVDEHGSPLMAMSLDSPVEMAPMAAEMPGPMRGAQMRVLPQQPMQMPMPMMLPQQYVLVAPPQQQQQFVAAMPYPMQMHGFIPMGQPMAWQAMPPQAMPQQQPQQPQQQPPQQPPQQPQQQPQQQPPPHRGTSSPPGATAGGKVPWGSLVATAMDPKGSRELQQLLPKLSKGQLARARDELAPHMHALSRHTFGNYLVSKLAPLAPMHAALAAAFRGRVVELLCHAQGSRVVQAYLAAAAPAEAESLVSELDGHVVECALDTHGSWGVCVAYSATHAPFLLRQISASVVQLSLEQHGCRVVQSVLQEAGNAGVDCSAAVGRIIGGGLEELALHRFANYAVQVALRQCGAAQREAMLGALMPRLLPLSASKHGSNVAEVVLSLASGPLLDAAAESIFGAGEPASAALRQLVEHQFGNYVLQTLLRRLADGPRRAAALAKVREATTATNFGRSILSRLGEAEAA